MEYLASDKVAIIDLGTGEVLEEELEEDLVQEKIGGAGITGHFHKKFEQDDPIVLGAGLLTGSLVPGAALGVMTARSPLTGKVCHVPLTLDAGMELKYSGFDYLIIKGASDKPVYLWIHDGIADIQDASEIQDLDVWAATDSIRETMGDEMVQVLGTGKAAQSGTDLAQVCINYWASGDRMGLGSLFGTKNLKLVAIRGMGLLEIAEPDEFVEACGTLLSEVKSSGKAGDKGIASCAAELGEEDISGWIGPLVHRHMACFNTPCSTNSFVFLDEDPAALKESEIPEPGFLLTDMDALLGFRKLGLSAADACGVLRECAKYGIDGAAVSELCVKDGMDDPATIKASLPDFKGPVDSAGDDVFSPWGMFAGQDPDTWHKIQAIAYLFGIHPVFALMFPEMDGKKLLELSNLGAELELTEGTLAQAMKDVTG